MPLARAELLRDVTHLRVGTAAVGESYQLPFEIPRVQAREPRCEAAVAFALQPVTGEAGIGRPGARPAERDQFAVHAEAVYRLRAYRGTTDKRERAGEYAEESGRCHSAWGTGAPPRRFRSGGHREGERLPPAVRILLPLAFAVGACQPPPEERTAMPLASAARGKLAIERAGCGSCHTIEGIGWPKGKTAPALERVDRRALIAGTLPNRPDVLAAFVRNAPALVPGTAMPAMPLSERESLDVAAYLYAMGR